MNEMIMNLIKDEVARIYARECKKSEKRTIKMKIEKWLYNFKQKAIRKLIDILEGYEYR